uniref:Uncharacterized protein n=1 Tax=Fervidicoccus fontis TaxID=683846 RepID=A0A7J3ZJQ9_9CREN
MSTESGIQVRGSQARVYCNGAVLSLSESRVVLEHLFIKGVSEGVHGSRAYVYIDLKSQLKIDSLFEKVCGRRGSLIVENFMFQCHSLSVGPLLVIVTPGFFRYERVIVSPTVVVVELVDRRSGSVRAEEDRVVVEL